MPRPIKIVLTGGGTAGHVLPHFALLPFYKEAAWQVLYVGTSGIEKQLAADAGLRFREIRAGKLRRHFSLQNILDVFWVLVGILQSFYILAQERPQIVFAKGGYVSVPVAAAAWLLRIPVITHESDLSPGLANKIIARFSKKILSAFPATLQDLPPAKAQWVGLPIRPDLGQGRKERGWELCGFRAEDPRSVVLVGGGSQGAAAINKSIENALPLLLEKFRVVHITGRGKQTSTTGEGYFQAEYLSDELKDIFAISELVVCRAGANTLFELLALHKPMLLIPLEYATRGDQLQNARAFSQKNWALILRENALSSETLQHSLASLQAQAGSITQAMGEFPANDVAKSIFRILETIVLESGFPELGDRA